MLDVANYTFAGFAVVIVLAVATATLLTQSMVVFERRRELAVLRAIGVRPVQLVRLLVYESMLLGLFGATLGVAVSAPVLTLLSRHGIDMSSGTELEFSGLLLDPIVFPTVDWSVAVEAVLTAAVLAGGASLIAGIRSVWRPALGVIREN
jgi:ABC-type lipoprotein release transport system permease subunit